MCEETIRKLLEAIHTHVRMVTFGFNGNDDHVLAELFVPKAS